LGCQFQIQVTPTGGSAFANAYKGSGGRPVCTVTGQFGGSGTWNASFSMQ
jgi:hypothetical protein